MTRMVLRRVRNAPFGRGAGGKMFASLARMGGGSRAGGDVTWTATDSTRGWASAVVRGVVDSLTNGSNPMSTQGRSEPRSRRFVAPNSRLAVWSACSSQGEQEPSR